jgi:ABC-type multidrug transport system fused ATPase/permease subunit
VDAVAHHAWAMATAELTGPDATIEERPIFRRGMRLVLAHIRTNPRPFWISVVGAFVFAIGSVLATVALGRVTDEVLRPAFTDEGVSSRSLWLGIGAIMLFTSMRAIGIGVRRYYSGVLGSAVGATLRDRVSDRYRDLPLAYHRAQPTGELLSHMEADVEASIEILYPIPFSIGAILLVAFALISLMLADPYLALVGALLLPALAIMNRTFAKQMQGPARRAQERIGEVSAVAHESVDGALVVKTLGREASEVARLAGKAEAVRVERTHAGRIRAAFEPALETLPSGASIILLAVGAWRLSTGDVTLGTLVQVVALFDLIAWPLRFIGWILLELPRAVVAHDRIAAVLAEEGTLERPSSPVRLPDGPLEVRTEALSYAFGGFTVLDEISFRVAPNESVAIVGQTGVGKSTLAQLLVRLDDPVSGEILLGGANLRHVDVRELRDHAAIVFQESFLFATTVTENIRLDAEASDEEIRRAADVVRADRFIRRLPKGYDTVLGERGYTLSGGERQRVALARALVRRPRLLILDDATSAVDPTIEAEILAGLRDEIDTTLVVVAYRLSTIRLADRVLYLEQGRLKATGPHDDLMAREPGYAAMVRAYERGER